MGKERDDRSYKLKKDERKKIPPVHLSASLAYTTTEQTAKDRGWLPVKSPRSLFSVEQYFRSTPRRPQTLSGPTGFLGMKASSQGPSAIEIVMEDGLGSQQFVQSRTGGGRRRMCGKNHDRTAHVGEAEPTLNKTRMIRRTLMSWSDGLENGSQSLIGPRN
ncbi:hypothetical protein Micbo1qcDRAFT_179452 [Microdochium bolleyi]|uniref:Uncharacterized protein n=1 Tax=Microdochium bolleyi TaxID=196109 RepID=A0A136IPG5_9PEZI|nr:hypothetical protein Micbo1qcDRAFT_179452 [Microdochium bolleyi]